MCVCWLTPSIRPSVRPPAREKGKKKKRTEYRAIIRLRERPVDWPNLRSDHQTLNFSFIIRTPILLFESFISLCLHTCKSQHNFAVHPFRLVIASEHTVTHSFVKSIEFPYYFVQVVPSGLDSVRILSSHSYGDMNAVTRSDQLFLASHLLLPHPCWQCPSTPRQQWPSPPPSINPSPATHSKSVFKKISPKNPSSDQ